MTTAMPQGCAAGLNCVEGTCTSSSFSISSSMPSMCASNADCVGMMLPMQAQVCQDGCVGMLMMKCQCSLGFCVMVGDPANGAQCMPNTTVGGATGMTGGPTTGGVTTGTVGTVGTVGTTVGGPGGSGGSDGSGGSSGGSTNSSGNSSNASSKNSSKASSKKSSVKSSSRNSSSSAQGYCCVPMTSTSALAPTCQAMANCLQGRFRIAARPPTRARRTWPTS